MKKLLIIAAILMLVGCSKPSYTCGSLSGGQYNMVNYTPVAIKNLKESNRKYVTERREYQKSQAQRIRRVYRLQTIKK